MSRGYSSITIFIGYLYKIVLHIISYAAAVATAVEKRS